jgi:hypothetical protein
LTKKQGRSIRQKPKEMAEPNCLAVVMLEPKGLSDGIGLASAKNL